MLGGQGRGVARAGIMPRGVVSRMLRSRASEAQSRGQEDLVKKFDSSGKAG